MLDLDQAFVQLAQITADASYTETQLRNLVEQVSLDTAPYKSQGSVTLLYSGKINGGVN